MKPINIGVFDSGQGGLTVWESILSRFPNLNVNYLADNARIPYGNKSASTVTGFTSQAILYLASQGAQLVVIACGTASSLAIVNLQNVFRIPLMGIVELFSAHVAQIASHYGKNIAILGTRSTVDSGRFVSELKMHGIQDVWQMACPMFVPLVEEGIYDGAIALATARLYLQNIPKQVNVVMLACTHYPRLINTIAQSLFEILERPVLYIRGETVVTLKESSNKHPVYLVDSTYAVAKEVENFLESHPQKHDFFNNLKHIYCTDKTHRFGEVAKIFTERQLPEIKLVDLHSIF